MKKILLIVCLLTSMFATAQSVSIRAGSPPHDNTFRPLTIWQNTTGDQAGLDTVKLYPSGYINIVSPNGVVNDTLFYSVNSTQSYNGDMMYFQFTSAADTIKAPLIHFVVNSGFSFGNADSLVLIKGPTLKVTGRATIAFRFDGVKWQESEAKLIK